MQSIKRLPFSNLIQRMADRVTTVKKKASRKLDRRETKVPDQVIYEIRALKEYHAWKYDWISAHFNLNIFHVQQICRYRTAANKGVPKGPLETPPPIPTGFKRRRTK
jgi:hypothetical protein